MSTQFAPIWNNASLDLTCIRANVTNTNSGSGSTLLDLLVNGSSKFKVDKSGALSIGDWTTWDNDSLIKFGTGSAAATFTLQLGSGVSLWFTHSRTALGIASRINGVDTNPTLVLRSDGKLGWATGTSVPTESVDLFLQRDAAGILAQRRANTAGPTTYPQAFRIYNNVDGTDTAPGSNWERAKIAWESNVLKIGTEGLGTGAVTPRSVELINATIDSQANSNLIFSGTGTLGRGFQITGESSKNWSVFVGGSGIASAYQHGFALFESASNGYRLVVQKDNGPIYLGTSRLQIGGTTSSFPAIKRNSAALNFRLADDSADCDITAGGASFSGNITGANQSGYVQYIKWNDAYWGGMTFYGNTTAVATIGNNTAGGKGLLLHNSSPLFFSALADNTFDVAIYRDAANTLAQRNDTSAQSLRIYKTYSGGGTNFERGVLDWQTTSDVFRIGTEAGGTGTVRNIALVGGNVGIGTTSPGHPLEIQMSSDKRLKINQTGQFNTGIEIARNDQVNNTTWQLYNPSGSTDLRFYNGGERLTLQSSGNVGIGTASPSYKTQISGTYNTVALGLTGTHAADDIGLFISPSAITGSYTAISANPSATTGVNYSFGNSNASSSSAHSRLDIYTTSANGGDPKTTYTISGVRNWCVGVDNSDSDKFKISASDSPGSGDYLTIDTSGNVSVNSGSITSYNAVSTTTPSYLDLLSWSTNSWWRLSANYNSGTNEFAIANQNTGWIPFFAKGSDSTIRLTGAIEHSQTTTAQSYKIYNTTDGINYERGKIAWESNVLKIGTEKAGTGAARALELQTDGTTRLTVTAAGKVELGTISASANAPLRIQVDGAGRAFVLSYSSTEYTEFVSGGVVKGLLGTGTVPMALSNAGDIYFERASVEVLRVNSSGLTVSQNLTLSTKNLVTDTTTGTKIGTGTTQKLGFYNATPVVQPAAVADATDAASVITQLNLLLARMRDLGLIAT